MNLKKSLTRDEVKAALAEGKKVSHIGFMITEYLIQEDESIYDEMGRNCRNFWNLMRARIFDKGWYVVQ